MGDGKIIQTNSPITATDAQSVEPNEPNVNDNPSLDPMLVFVICIVLIFFSCVLMSIGYMFVLRKRKLHKQISTNAESDNDVADNVQDLIQMGNAANDGNALEPGAESTIDDNKN